MRYALAVLACACASVNTDELAPIDGFESWYSLDVTGPVGGHGDTYRIIHVNDVGRTYPHGGRYPVGTIVVKEIRQRTPEGGPGALDYLAIMRKVGADAELDSPVEGGWVFTQKKADGAERWLELCWGTCHRQAPVDGAFFDYGE